MRIIDESLVLLELGLSDSVTEEERAIVQQAVVKAEGAVRQFLRYDPTLAQRTEFYPQQQLITRSRKGLWETDGNQAVFQREASTAVDELQLVHLPVRSSPAIDLRIESDARHGTKSGSFGESSKKVEGQDFWPQYDMHDSAGSRVCNDGILKSFGRWPLETGSVKVVYWAGYTDDELNGQDSVIDASPIMEVAVEEALRRVKKVLTLWKKNNRTGHNAGTITSENMGDYSYSLNPGLLDKALGGGSLAAGNQEKLNPFVNWGYAL